jgi:hypothetical protein
MHETLLRSHESLTGRRRELIPIVVTLTANSRQETELFAGHTDAAVIIFADLFIDRIKAVL